ncbi:MAG: hypothetical protein ACE5EO_08130 [Candidatus Krumholzibacteriia bacterium]
MTRSRIVPTLSRFALFCVALLLAGCGGSDTPSVPLIINPGGTGTMTLQVNAQALGADAGPGGSLNTDFIVAVSDTLGGPVSGAAVAVQTPYGIVTLTEDPLTPGTYNGVSSAYQPGVYSVSVVRGPDNVSGVSVVGPDIHTITSPAAQATVGKDIPIDVRWTRSATAQESRVETRDYVGNWSMSDPGVMTVPASGNPPRVDQRFRVKRANRQAAAGGLAGSDFRVRIRTTVEPVISQ